MNYSPPRLIMQIDDYIKILGRSNCYRYLISKIIRLFDITLYDFDCILNRGIKIKENRPIIEISGHKSHFMKFMVFAGKKEISRTLMYM